MFWNDINDIAPAEELYNQSLLVCYSGESDIRDKGCAHTTCDHAFGIASFDDTGFEFGWDKDSDVWMLEGGVPVTDDSLVVHAWAPIPDIKIG